MYLYSCVTWSQIPDIISVVMLSANFHVKLCGFRNTYLFVPALNDRGLSCSDITHVVCSHGHSDHVGNLNLFPEALLIVSFDICHGDTYFENGLAKVSVWCI